MSPWYFYEALVDVRLSFVCTGIHAIRAHVSYCFPNASADSSAFRPRQAKREMKFHGSFPKRSLYHSVTPWYIRRNYYCTHGVINAHVSVRKAHFNDWREGVFFFLQKATFKYRLLNTLTRRKICVKFHSTLARFIYRVTYTECIKRPTYFIIWKCLRYTIKSFSFINVM